MRHQQRIYPFFSLVMGHYMYATYLSAAVHHKFWVDNITTTYNPYAVSVEAKPTSDWNMITIDHRRDGQSCHASVAPDIAEDIEAAEPEPVTLYPTPDDTVSEVSVLILDDKADAEAIACSETSKSERTSIAKTCRSLLGRCKRISNKLKSGSKS